MGVDVLLVGNYSFDHQTSMRLFAQMLESGLRERGLQVALTIPPAVLFPKTNRNDGFWKWVGYLNKFVFFPPVLWWRARHANIVHICDHSNAIYVRSLARVPHIVTCHDVIAIRAALTTKGAWRVRWSGRILQRIIMSGLARARRIVCVSALTSEQLLELLPELAHRVEVIPNGLNFPFRQLPALQARLLLEEIGADDTQFFLHVGSGHVRKNRAQVVRIFARLLELDLALQQNLIFVGGAPNEDIRDLIVQLKLSGRVRMLSAVNDEQLCALYSVATGLIYPSILEGFGWPVIEAQACGCPVFCSDLRPMTDIAKDSAIFFNPSDVDAAALKILDALKDTKQLVEAGFANAEKFSCQAMVDAYLHAYECLLNPVDGAGATVSSVHAHRRT